MNNERMTDAEMAEEARRWAEGELPAEKLVDAPDAVPRAKESVAISIRLPSQMVSILKEFARRAGIGYQVLMKRWLDDRIRRECEKRRATISFTVPRVQVNAAFCPPQPVNELSRAALLDEFGQMALEVDKKDKGPL
jgi:predicted DNA binding CopG/RHH family protein